MKIRAIVSDNVSQCAPAPELSPLKPQNRGTEPVLVTLSHVEQMLLFSVSSFSHSFFKPEIETIIF